MLAIVPSGSVTLVPMPVLLVQMPGSVGTVAAVQDTIGGWLIGGISTIPALENVTCSH